jgi:hypothetical protein
VGSRSSGLGANLSHSPNLGCETRNRTSLTLPPPRVRARGMGRAGAGSVWPLAALHPITHLTRSKISHLYNDQTLRLADVVSRRFCYTIKCPPVRQGGCVLWPEPQEGAAIRPGGSALWSVGCRDIEGRGAEDGTVCSMY